MRRRFSLSTVALAATILPVSAHPGHVSGVDALSAGFAHPLLGLDHVLAMMAVGLWAAVLGGRAVWVVPTAFVACMLGGFAFSLAGMRLPAVEPGIAASVIVLGILIAGAIRVSLAGSACLVGLFAVLHGQAHGGELSGTAPMFALGFMGATALLHGAGIGLGRLLARPRHGAFMRGVGGAIASIGVVVLLGGLS